MNAVKANFKNMNINILGSNSYVSFYRAVLTYTNFSGADIQDIVLNNGISFEKTFFFGVTDESSLPNHTGVSIINTTANIKELVGNNMVGIDLSGINLTNVNFIGVNLKGANLTGTTLTGTNLTGADLRDVKGFVQNDYLGTGFKFNGEIAQDLNRYSALCARAQVQVPFVLKS